MQTNPKIIIALTVGIAVGAATTKRLSKKQPEAATEKPAEQKIEVPTKRPATKARAQEEESIVVANAPAPEIETPEQKAKHIRKQLRRVFNGKASTEEQLAFWEQMRTSPEITDIIREQEQQTPLDSDDIDAHMNIAQLYVAKLVSVAAGPEKGLWAGKAEERWRTVLENDPTHWEAQHSVAFSLSMYPDFLNKTGEAITEYEKLLTIQREQEPQPQHARSYLELHRLYQKRGDPVNALDVLEEGLERFPDNKQLIEQRNHISAL